MNTLRLVTKTLNPLFPTPKSSKKLVQGHLKHAFYVENPAFGELLIDISEQFFVNQQLSIDVSKRFFDDQQLSIDVSKRFFDDRQLSIKVSVKLIGIQHLPLWFLFGDIKGAVVLNKNLKNNSIN